MSPRLAGRAASALSAVPATSKPKPKLKRSVQHRPTAPSSGTSLSKTQKNKAQKAGLVRHIHAHLPPGPTSLRPKPSPTKSILKPPDRHCVLPARYVRIASLDRPCRLSRLRGSSDPTSVPPDHESLSSRDPEVPLSANGSLTNGVAPASGTLIKRRPAVGVLDVSAICVCP